MTDNVEELKRLYCQAADSLSYYNASEGPCYNKEASARQEASVQLGVYRGMLLALGEELPKGSWLI
jgi:hypothetical protein